MDALIILWKVEESNAYILYANWVENYFLL